MFPSLHFHSKVQNLLAQKLDSVETTFHAFQVVESPLLQIDVIVHEGFVLCMEFNQTDNRESRRRQRSLRAKDFTLVRVAHKKAGGPPQRKKLIAIQIAFLAFYVHLRPW